MVECRRENLEPRLKQINSLYMKSFITILFLSCVWTLHLAATQRPTKPNVLLILTDDLGWQDVGCYDVDEPCLFDTPNIDQLAREGILFRQGYSPAPTCAPTRIAILSGKHPARSQKTHVVGGKPPSPYSNRSPMISPWYSGRMKVSEVTIPEALKENGYVTGCVGKWHCAISHHAFPQPTDHGFDFARMNLGVTKKMKNRLTGFATGDEADPFRLDEKGFPRHQNSEDALEFIQQNKSDPFFLYYATWLVHTPIHTRNEALLKKYCERMKIPLPTNPTGWPTEGQKNPYYASMVETLDYHIGRLLDYLRTTDDPRWPGHKLIENTYVVFTSDNGGMERVPGEQITDNYPLDKGKINIKEGGIRVPLIITGPDIGQGVESDAVVNGLDFYPTIMSWTGTTRPKIQHLDGLDLSKHLESDMKQSPERDVMIWHFPHSQMHSAIRKGNYKLIRNWQNHFCGRGPGLELYQLYDDSTGKRIDIEEAKNLAAKMPEKVSHLDSLLSEKLTTMQASPPFLNPDFKPSLPNSEKVCLITDQGRDENLVWVKFSENGAKVIKAQLIYTDNGGEKYEEWYRSPAKLVAGHKAEAELPKGTTHYVWNLIDENHFLVSHPQMRTEKESKEPYSKQAITK